MQNEYWNTYSHVIGCVLNMGTHFVNVLYAPSLDAASVALLLTGLLALTNFCKVFYFIRLAINHYRSYREGANHLTLSMVLLYASLGLVALWGLIVSIIESPIVGIYQISITHITVLSLSVFFDILVLFSCWHFDMALFRMTVEEASDEKAEANAPGHN